MNTMASGNESAKIGSKQFLRVAIATAAILLIPFVAMQFTREVNWTTSDFVIAAVLLAGTGMLFELARAKLRTRKSRLIASVVIGFCFLFVWAELAVGLVGSPFAGS
jgi:peptidoglycan/LPS O-acetylase OafA/YrhL